MDMPMVDGADMPMAGGDMPMEGGMNMDSGMMMNGDMMMMNGSMNMMGMHMMMQMTFHFSHSVPMGLLFDFWTVQTVGELIGAVVVWFILGILYEGLKTLREYLLYVDKEQWKKCNRCCNAPAVTYDKSIEAIGNVDTKVVEAGLSKLQYYSVSLSMHLLQSVLHIIQVGYGYLLMLVTMTYNGWLFLAVVFGAGVGYLLFAKTRHFMGNPREQNECCH